MKPVVIFPLILMVKVWPIVTVMRFPSSMTGTNSASGEEDGGASGEDGVVQLQPRNKLNIRHKSKRLFIFTPLVTCQAFRPKMNPMTILKAAPEMLMQDSGKTAHFKMVAEVPAAIRDALS